MLVIVNKHTAALSAVEDKELRVLALYRNNDDIHHNDTIPTTINIAHVYARAYG